MPEHSFRCTCGNTIRIYFALDQYPYPDILPCSCGGGMARFFERAPGMAPDFFMPYFDQGLGQWVKSRQHRKEVAASLGFDEILGPEEYERSAKAHVPKDEFTFTEHEKEVWRDCADKAMNDLKYGNVAVPEMPTVDTAESVVSNPTAKGNE